MPTEKTLRAQYDRRVEKRRPFLRRARACAKLTVPSLVPEEGASASDEFETPYQSMGARGLKNLASKMLLALFPPNTPFFKWKIDDFALSKLGEGEERAEVEEALNRAERAVALDLEGSASRVTLFEALKHLLVAGNVVVWLPDEGNMRLFRLDQYVIERDPSGNLLRLIIKESVSPLTLDEEVRQACKCEDAIEEDKPVEVYTEVIRDDKDEQWNVHQEINEELVPGSEGHYPFGKSPWIAPRGVAIDGEDYGRSYVEELFGDLQTLEDLTRAIVDGSNAAAKLLILLQPGATTKAKDLEKPSGSVVKGDSNEVGFLHMEKFADFRVAFETIGAITERLSFAFLLNTAVQRDAERVTAEEVRFMAQELEDALGGIYSVLSQELQMPLAMRATHRMQTRRALPQMPKEVTPVVTTGLEALGRNHEQSKLDELIRRVVGTLGEDVAAQWLIAGDYIKRTGSNLGVDTRGLVRTKEQVGQMTQQAQLMQFIQQAGPKMLQELTKQAGQNQQET